jgi:hypothetical protein
MMTDDGLQIVVIQGGFADGERDLAHSPGTDLNWQRWPTETRAEFRDRAIVAARAAGARSIVFGGFDD